MRGFARLSVAVPRCRVGALKENVNEMLSIARGSHDDKCHVVVFPELCITGYTARDLFFDGQLLARAEQELLRFTKETKKLNPLFLVGLPLVVNGALFNAAVAVQNGEILGGVPKSFLPNYCEFEERRWFRPGTDLENNVVTCVGEFSFPFGTQLLFACNDFKNLVVGAEICEDFWVQKPPSADQVGAGATLICNLSASNFTVGKADLRRLLARSISDRGKCAYAYVAAGPGESSTDLAFDADAFICENGTLLCESKRFSRVSQQVSVDVDVESLVRERQVTNSFFDCAAQQRREYSFIPFTGLENNDAGDLKRQVSAHPFLPAEPNSLATRCWEIFEIQCNALLTRMQAIGRPKLILGVSGGLDSTQAALVAAQSLDLDQRPRMDLICVTLPGLGTTSKTRSSAEKLSESLGATFISIDIGELSRMVLSQTEHGAAADTVKELVQKLRDDETLGDATFENVQARLRTLVLMTLANQHGGIVVGTGDLSEKALGWATYAGDHIAMYDVNAGIPKTLIQFVIRWVADERIATWSYGQKEELKETLESILATPISPELLPPDEDGNIKQLTEDTIGPYELHDFFLFYLVRHGARPARILDLAQHAFGKKYDVTALKRWLRLFYRRFVSQQFKRSCTADAPKIGMVALSPRGDWRMPSDAQARGWLDAVDAYK
ncbi:MAG: NAD(+) synthase [Deltaproteobacteria bacterium]|nr:NAD(+) synthase [Deltaproteobacteria bacterium]